MTTQTNGHHEPAETTGADLRVPIRIFCSFDGWPVHLDLLLAPGRLGAAIDRLQALGYEPQRQATPAERNEGPPSCPHHGPSKVRESQHKPGTFYCAAKLPDGSYCKEKPQ